VLVDGAVAQIDAIRVEAAKRGVDIKLVIDFIHVLQYLNAAARVLHGDTDKAATAVAALSVSSCRTRAAALRYCSTWMKSMTSLMSTPRLAASTRLASICATAPSTS